MKNKIDKIIVAFKNSKFPLKKLINAIYLVFSIFCIASISKELFLSDSILGKYMSCPTFLRASVVLEIIKIIGFSNIFLSLLYTNLSKKMLAISYEDILRYFSPLHNFYTIFHIICNLGCLSLAAGGLSESALASLILVINGFVYQWIILYNIVINSNKCEKLSKSMWMEKAKSGKNKLYEELYLLAKTLPERSSKQYCGHIECFTNLLSAYSVDEIDETQIKTISIIWRHCLEHETVDNILEDISISLFEKLKENNNGYEVLCNVFTAYMFCKLCPKEKNAEKTDMSTIFRTLINDTLYFRLLSPIRLNEELKESYKIFINCWCTNIHILAWVFFQQGMLPLSKTFLNILPNTTDLEYKYAEKLTYAIFLSIGETDEKIQNAFDIAKQQLQGRLEIEGNNR